MHPTSAFVQRSVLTATPATKPPRIANVTQQLPFLRTTSTGYIGFIAREQTHQHSGDGDVAIFLPIRCAPG